LNRICQVLFVFFCLISSVYFSMSLFPCFPLCLPPFLYFELLVFPYLSLFICLSLPVSQSLHFSLWNVILRTSISVCQSPYASLRMSVFVSQFLYLVSASISLYILMLFFQKIISLSPPLHFPVLTSPSSFVHDHMKNLFQVIVKFNCRLKLQQVVIKNDSYS